MSVNMYHARIKISLHFRKKNPCKQPWPGYKIKLFKYKDMTSIWCSLTFWWRQLLRSLRLLWLWLGCLLMLWLLLLLWMMVILCWCLLKVLLLSSYRRLFWWRLKHFLLYFRLLFWRLILIHCWTTLSSFIGFFWFNLQK